MFDRGPGYSRASGYFFLGSLPVDGQHITLNGPVHVLCSLLKFVAASAAEAELGALFLNAKQALILRLTLRELGHPQPPTPIHVDNSTTVGIVNNTVKRQKSRSMEMRYFWLLDGNVNKEFQFKHCPGEEILADYQSKAHTGAYHRMVRPLFLQMHNSPRVLLRSKTPSERRGCVKTPEHTYLRSIRKSTVLPSYPSLARTRIRIRPLASPAG